MLHTLRLVSSTTKGDLDATFPLELERELDEDSSEMSVSSESSRLSLPELVVPAVSPLSAIFHEPEHVARTDPLECIAVLPTAEP